MHWLKDWFRRERLYPAMLGLCALLVLILLQAQDRMIYDPGDVIFLLLLVFPPVIALFIIQDAIHAYRTREKVPMTAITGVPLIMGALLFIALLSYFFPTCSGEECLVIYILPIFFACYVIGVYAFAGIALLVQRLWKK